MNPTTDQHHQRLMAEYALMAERTLERLELHDKLTRLELAAMEAKGDMLQVWDASWDHWQGITVEEIGEAGRRYADAQQAMLDAKYPTDTARHA